MARLGDAQLSTLHTDITVTRADVMHDGATLLDWYTKGDDEKVAEFYNGQHQPVEDVWKPDVRCQDINQAIVSAEFDMLTGNRRETWGFTLSHLDPIDTTIGQVRDNFQYIFPNTEAPLTFANIMALAQRNATYGEVLYGVRDQGAYISDIYGQRITADNVSDTRRV